MLNFENKKLKIAFISTQLVIAAASVFLTFLMMEVTSTLPDIKYMKTTEPEQSTQIFDVNDALIAEINKDENRVCVPLEKVSHFFVSAVVAIEDLRFYEHRGIDFKGTIRAFVNNLTGVSSIQGGSTITQQLVKNWFLMPQKSFKRKFLEAVLAARVENSLSKEEIIEKYINLIYLGNRAYGVEKAANKYFDKKAGELNLAEAALLAGLIKAPEQYSPYINLKRALARQKIVLDRMYKYGFITKTQWEEAFETPLAFKSQVIASFNKYPYFVDHVARLLRERYGNEVVDRGGLKVYTTLDPVAQEIAEKTVIEGVKKHRYAGVKQGALVSIDVKKGYINAIVGGVDYAESQFNRATMAKRATGSGFKPIVYLTGLRLGLITPDSYVLDAPIAYRTKWNVWRPHNWDGQYKGRMTVRQALTLSRNTPTVRIALEAGLDKVIETARLLGIRSHMDRGYSIVLGSAGITPLEIATMYSTLAREGVYLEPIAIRYITDPKDNIIESNRSKPVRVIDSKPVQQLISILVDVVQKGTGKNAILEGRQIAGKTGTTDDFKDVWFSGFTPDTVTTIWMGNDENRPIRGVWSSNCAALWKNFSKEYYDSKTIIAETFNTPEKNILKKPQKKKEEVAENPDVEQPPQPQHTETTPPHQQIKPKIQVGQGVQQQIQQQPQVAQPQVAQPQVVQPQPVQQQVVQYPQYPQYPQYQQYPQYRQTAQPYQQPQYYQRSQYQQRPYYPQANQYPRNPAYPQYQQRPAYNYYNR